MTALIRPHHGHFGLLLLIKTKIPLLFTGGIFCSLFEHPSEDIFERLGLLFFNREMFEHVLA